MGLCKIAVRCRMTTRSVIATALAMTLVILSNAPASAQQAKCLSGKTLCMSKKTAGMLKCEALAATPGKPVDPNANDCRTKVAAKWDGGSNPAKGCFERLENKPTNDCLTVDDAGPAGAAIDDCVASLIAAIDPAPLDQTTCGAGKRRCVSKYVGALLKCRRAAQTPGKPVDPNANGCVDKAVAKFTGGANPAKSCFARLEAQASNDCQFTGDASAVQAVADDCHDDLGAVLTCGDGNLDPGETCDGASQTAPAPRLPCAATAYARGARRATAPTTATVPAIAYPTAGAPHASTISPSTTPRRVLHTAGSYRPPRAELAAMPIRTAGSPAGPPRSTGAFSRVRLTTARST